MINNKKLLIVAITALMTAACTQDTYETESGETGATTTDDSEMMDDTGTTGATTPESESTEEKNKNIKKRKLYDSGYGSDTNPR